MNQGIQEVGLYVRDQDEALAFYVGKLGFRVHTDVRNGDYRWLTVQHPEQPSFQLGLFMPGPPVHDEATAQSVRAIVAKGAMPPLVLAVDDCRAAYERMRAARRRVHAGAGEPLRQRRRRLSRPVGQRLEDDRTPPRRQGGGVSRWGQRIRQLHRWLSMAFVLTVLANLVALRWPDRPVWIGIAALLPLALLLLTGLYMFVLPYAGKRRQAGAEVESR